MDKKGVWKSLPNFFFPILGGAYLSCASGQKKLVLFDRNSIVLLQFEINM